MTEADILARIKPWCGGPEAAKFWVMDYLIPAFGQKTARQLIDEGKIDALNDYLTAIEDGAFV